MLEDKLRKVECKFYDNVISYCKDRMFFHLGYRYDGNGWVGIATCSKAHLGVKALFAQCGGLVLPPLNNMEILAHILDGWTKDVPIETLNPSVEGEFDVMF
jgi:hypothetical protein